MYERRKGAASLMSPAARASKKISDGNKFDEDVDTRDGDSDKRELRAKAALGQGPKFGSRIWLLG